MKIAITGHKQGIGKAFAEQLSARGHKIIWKNKPTLEGIVLKVRTQSERYEFHYL